MPDGDVSTTMTVIYGTPLYLVIFRVTLSDLCGDVLSVFVAVPNCLRVKVLEVPGVDQCILEEKCIY